MAHEFKTACGMDALTLRESRARLGMIWRSLSEDGDVGHFALGLPESKVCVGWHSFKYSDNDPNDKAADPSNRDSNKGIVNAVYETYTPLLDAMKPLNDRMYGLIKKFDHP